MQTYAFIFLIIAIIAGINAGWVALWALLGASGTMGAQLSKKTGMDNKDTDRNIAQSKAFTNELLKKTLIRGGIAVVAYVIYLILS